MTVPVVHAAGLTRRFREVTALDRVDLDIAPDTVTGLLGRNGAGKTTLMQLLTGAESRTAGSLTVFGAEPWENPAVLSRTCFVRESQQYPDDFRVRQVLSAAQMLYPSWNEAGAADLLRRLRLPVERRVKKLSRGMRSALGVVVGLAARAELTIFDEPTLGLDATSRELFYDTLLADVGDHPRTVLLSSHLIDEVADVVGSVVVLDAGRVVLRGAADDLRARWVAVTGPAEAVNRIAAGRDELSRQGAGGFVRAVVSCDPDHPLPADATGISVEAVSLQQVVVGATTTAPLTSEEAVS